MKLTEGDASGSCQAEIAAAAVASAMAAWLVVRHAATLLAQITA
jgi:hypothetical protein